MRIPTGAATPRSQPGSRRTSMSRQVMTSSPSNSYEHAARTWTQPPITSPGSPK
jgi:hypothetical protein